MMICHEKGGVARIKVSSYRRFTLGRLYGITSSRDRGAWRLGKRIGTR